MPEDREALVEWVEMLEDSHIAQKALADLQAAGQDRQRAGWREWSDAEKELK